MITREIIIKTALKLFLENGVKTITMTRLTKDLHTSKRTIYNHFEDKTELLKACLYSYHTEVRKENREIISSASNAIEAMGILLHQILRRASTVNPNFFNDIIHYYPGLLNKSYRDTGNFAHQQLFHLAEWGKEEGIFMQDMDVEVVAKTVGAMLKLFKDNNQFPVSEFSKERLTFGILVPYMRGLCTPEGVELLEKQEELFRVTA